MTCKFKLPHLTEGAAIERQGKKTDETLQLPGETKTELLLIPTIGLDADGVTPQTLRLKFYCS
jgi:hypothetical protein